MDLEQLNKSQLVLLTIFVSFMTSTATGIVTASLMQQAPLAITETVNRVVERTVERVVPGQAASVAAPTTVTETVVVKESDLIAQAVEKSSPSIVRIYTADATSSAFLSLGVVLDSVGTIATDASAIDALKHVSIEVAGSMRVPGTITTYNKSTGVIYITAATSTSEGKPLAWKPFALGTQSGTIGQTVVAVGGKSVARIGQGIVTAVTDTDGVSIIETSIAKDSILPGSPIIDTSGSVLGLSTSLSRAVAADAFIPSAALKPAKKESTDTSQ